MSDSTHDEAPVLDAVPDGIVIVDTEGVIRRLNTQAERLFGYERSELIGEPVEQLLPERFRAEHTALRHQFASAPDIRPMGTEIETTGLCSDGTEFPTEISLGPVDIDGEPHIVAAIRDVSEQRSLEQKLRKSRTRLLEAERIADIGHWTLDLQTDTLVWSEQVHRIFDMTSEEFERADDPFYQRVHPEDRRRVRQAVQEAIRGDEPYDIEHRIVLANGEERFVRERANISRDEKGAARQLLGVVQDITESRRMREKLEKRVLKDALTGLSNRFHFEECLRQILRSGSDGSLDFAIAFIDLDDFKVVNDSLGHAAGDRVLREVGRRLRNSFTPEHTVARIGGDEFMLLIRQPPTPPTLDEIVAELRDRFAAPFRVRERDVHLSVSIGAVDPREVLDSSDHERPPLEVLVRAADRAMYRAKKTPGISLRHFDPQLDSGASTRLSLENGIRRGLSDGQFLPYYQPIVSMQTGGISAVEGLARWDHPERGILTAGDFIPVAEQSDLILEMGEALVEAACRDWGSLERDPAHQECPTLFINLSPHQFEDPQLYDRLDDAIGISAEDRPEIAFEITEGEAMREPHQVSELRSLGFQVYVDDFGTGYSSLRYLRDLEVDGLKIDMSFIRGLPDRESDAAIVDAIADLGSRLGLGVVAEGVEQLDQLEFILQSECTHGQGHFFSRPMPFRQLYSYLGEHTPHRRLESTR